MFVSDRFISHNLFWQSLEQFVQNDKHLQDLAKYKYVYNFPWTEKLARTGVNVVSGPRQIGKTTSIKQLIKRLLEDGCNPEQIFFLACDALSDRDDLYATLKSFLSSSMSGQQTYIFIDEVTFLPTWELSIKALIDEGAFRNSLVVITASDAIVLEDAAGAFPGVDRRGQGEDIIVPPLDFQEYLKLVDNDLYKEVSQEVNEQNHGKMIECFGMYLQTGGFISSINQYFSNGVMTESLLEVYRQWIYSNFLRKNKSKRKLIDLFALLYSRIASQISFSELARESLEFTTETLMDYIAHLERLGIVRVLYSLDVSKKKASPKKSKKILFQDPFFAQVFHYILVKEMLISDESRIADSALAEGVVATFYAGKYPVFYIKSKQEIDIAYLNQGNIYPVEVKWKQQIKEREVQELKKYPNSLILRKIFPSGKINEVPVRSLVSTLLD